MKAVHLAGSREVLKKMREAKRVCVCTRKSEQSEIYLFGCLFK